MEKTFRDIGRRLTLLAATLVLLAVVLTAAPAIAVDTYEPDDTISQATTIGPGVTQIRSFEGTATQDWIAIQVVEGMAYEVLVGAGPTWYSGDETSVFLEFFASEDVRLQPVWHDHWFQSWIGRRTFRNSFVATASGEVYLHVTSGPRGYADYAVLVTERQPNVVAGQVRSIVAGGGQPGWEVRLHTADGYFRDPTSLIATTTTDLDGRYRFATALDDVYCSVEFLAPSGTVERSGWWGEEVIPRFPEVFFNSAVFQIPRRTVVTATCDYVSYGHARIEGAVGVPENALASGLTVNLQRYNDRYTRWEAAASATTVADGAFAIDDLDPRLRYRYSVLDPANELIYLPGWTETTVTAAGPLSIAPTMAVAGSIAGRVTDTLTGAAVASATIEIYSQGRTYYSARLGVYQTDAEGRFRIPGLRTGNYAIFIKKPSEGYQPSWFNARPEFAEPDAIAVVVGEQTVVDVTLNPDSRPPSTSLVNLTNFTSLATVSLVTTDAAPSSGVAKTYYRIDSTTADFIEYVGPVEVSGFGAHTIEYWSVDGAGNTEPRKTSTFYCWEHTMVSLAVSSTQPAYNAFVTLSARLSDTDGWPIAGRPVRFERLSGTTWVHVATELTDGDGIATTWAQGLTGRQTWRAVFPSTAPWVTSTSPSRTITPYAKVGVVSSPSTVRPRTFFSAKVTLNPRHRAGSSAARIYGQRYENGKWVTRGSWSAIAANYGSGSLCTARVRLPYAGRWRLWAQHVDSDHSTTKGGYRYLTAK